MKRGSVTVFLALVLVLVLSFVFSMLEGARVHCLKGKAQTVTELCMQSVFGNYHGGLWEDYHLLFLDGTWQEGEFSIERLAQKAMSEAEQNLSFTGSGMIGSTWDLTSLTARDIEITAYELATDDAGSAFQNQVSLQMQMEAAENVLEELFQIKEQGEGIKEQQEQKEETWQQAWNAMEQAQEEAEEETGNILGEASGDESAGNASEETSGDESAGDTSEENTQETMVENPMDYVKELKSSSLLAMVLEDPSQLSGKAVERGSFLEDRQLLTGNWTREEEGGRLDRLWLQYYIQNYFSNYTADSEKGAEEKVLSYEMEYIIGGKASDSENLEQVVGALLGVREVMNFMTIMQDAEKKSLALSIATTAVGFTGLLPLIKAVQAGILLAWAFVESVLDVRTLLEGKKIPFLKGTHQWASDLTNCRKSIEDNAKTGEDEEGLNYSQYLQILLFLQSEEIINYRCMDLIERNEQIQMDAMIQAVEGVFTYQAKPLFWSFNFLAQSEWESFSLPVETSFSYGN